VELFNPLPGAGFLLHGPLPVSQAPQTEVSPPTTPRVPFGDEEATDMTSFTLSGGFNGHPVEITWIDGVLSGDPEFVQFTELRATARDNQLLVASGGSSASTDYLSDPYAAYELMCMLLDEPEIVSGELPPIPQTLQE
jgi:hypothetical protein